MTPRLSILMPVFDEEATVQAAIDAVLATELSVESELIVVDDGSTDTTPEILAGVDQSSDRITVLQHAANLGKGAAVRTALGKAKGEFCAIFDADLEYDPRDLEPLLAPLIEGRTNAVFGVRVFDGYTSHSFLFVMGNRGVTLVANLLYNVYLRDIMTCHKAIRTEVFRELPLRASGFAIEPEITARLVERGERIYEVPVTYRARSSDEGKKLTAADGFRTVATLARCRFLGPR